MVIVEIDQTKSYDEYFSYLESVPAEDYPSFVRYLVLGDIPFLLLNESRAEEVKIWAESHGKDHPFRFYVNENKLKLYVDSARIYSKLGNLRPLRK